MADEIKLEKFVLDKQGVSDCILNSADTMAYLESLANSRCPSGCVVNVKRGARRANARIVTDTASAYRDNLKNNTLLHAIG